MVSIERLLMQIRKTLPDAKRLVLLLVALACTGTTGCQICCFDLRHRPIFVPKPGFPDPVLHGYRETSWRKLPFEACPTWALESPVEAEPDPQREGAYSWAKAPRYAGETAEAGPLARLVNDRDPLITDLLSKHGPSVLVREVARLHETVRLVRQIGVWLRQIGPEQPFGSLESSFVWPTTQTSGAPSAGQTLDGHATSAAT